MNPGGAPRAEPARRPEVGPANQAATVETDRAAGRWVSAPPAAARGAAAAPAVVAERADVLYPLMVLWAQAGIDPAEGWAEPARPALVPGKGRAGDP